MIECLLNTIINHYYTLRSCEWRVWVCWHKCVCGLYFLPWFRSVYKKVCCVINPGLMERLGDYKKLRSLKGREGNSRQHQPPVPPPHTAVRQSGGWSQISPGAQADGRENMDMIPQEACSLCGYDSLGNPWQTCIHHLCATYVFGHLYRRGESKHWALFNLHKFICHIIQFVPKNKSLLQLRSMFFNIHTYIVTKPVLSSTVYFERKPKIIRILRKDHVSWRYFVYFLP